MKKIESAILELLKDDARLSPKQLANLLGEKEKNVSDAIDAMEKSGIIVKYTTLINDERAGYDLVEALIEVRVSPTSKTGFDSIAEIISEHDEVKSVYLMSGSYDLCIMIEGKTLKEVAMFVSEKLSVIPNVLSTGTNFILKKYKSYGIVVAKSELTRQAIHP